MRKDGSLTKTIEYKGLRLKLYSFAVLMKSIGKSKNTILKYERLGFLPKPFFRTGTSRFYTEYELSILAECKYKYGIPHEIYDDRKYKFFDELQKQWSEIRKSILEGKEPDMPITLQFKNRLELVGFIQDVLKKAQVVSPIYAETVYNRIKEFRRM